MRAQCRSTEEYKHSKEFVQGVLKTFYDAIGLARIILLMKSGMDLARCASRKCAPTEVPDLNSWSPSTWASLFFGNWEYRATIFSANCFVRSLRLPLDSSVFTSHLFIFAAGIFVDPSVSVFIVSLFRARRTRFFSTFPWNARNVEMNG